MSVRVAVGTRSGASDLFSGNFTGAIYKDSVQVPLPGQQLSHRQTIFLNVSVANTAKLWSAPALRSIQVDKMIPSLPNVVIMGASSSNFTAHAPGTASTALRIAWSEYRNIMRQPATICSTAPR